MQTHTPPVTGKTDRTITTDSKVVTTPRSLLLSSLMSRALIALTIIGLLWLVLLQLLG